MQGVVTDIDGAFQLKVQPSQSLVISFLGISGCDPAGRE